MELMQLEMFVAMVEEGSFRACKVEHGARIIRRKRGHINRADFLHIALLRLSIFCLDMYDGFIFSNLLSTQRTRR